MIFTNSETIRLLDRLCFDVYETAVQKLATPKMWQLYVETLFELNADENIKPKVQKQLNDVCKKAVSSRMLSDTHLIDWVIPFTIHLFQIN